MPTKAQAYAQMAEQTAKQITGSRTGWTGFLTTVGRLYKYPYYEQLMIYAQRPDATACADFDLWNNNMRRYVRRGSKGIALIDPTGDTPKLRYVFDVKDTGGGEHSRRPFLWEMQDYHEAPVLEMLQDKFDENSENLSDAFYNIASALAKEYYDDHRADIPYIIDGSFLEDYDEDNIRVAFENAATVSIAYTLMQRCGLNPDEYFEHEDFLNVFDFNTPDTVALLGTAVSEQSEQVFRQISLTIAKTERERSKEHEQLNLQPERGLSDTRPHSDRAGTADRQVRQNEETVSHGASDTLIQFPTSVRETVSPPVGDRPDSHQTDGADNGRLAENADTARQNDTADGMDRSHEQPQSTGRGNDTDGAYIQLNLFPTEQEQIQRIADEQERVKTQGQSAFSMPTKENGQLSLEPKKEDLLANWLVDFFNSLDTKYKGTFYTEKPELKVWEHISSKKKNLSIHISSPAAQFSGNSAFTYFNREDKTDESTINEAIYNNKFLSELSKDKDFSITLAPDTIYIYYHNFESKKIDFTLADTFEKTSTEPVKPLSQVTPLYQGYLDVKNEYPNDIVLYPLGDFYEVFGADAEYAEKILDLRSTYRKIGLDDERVPMCGFPSHVLEDYTQKLLDNGRNVVLVSVEDGEKKPYFIRSTANEPTKEVTTEQETADTVQAVPSITPVEITKADIESALLHWNSDEDSKARMLSYMQNHSRERGTAEWLKNEYGGNLPVFTVTKDELSLELPWVKVQRHIGQLVAEGAFFSNVEVAHSVIDSEQSNTAELTLEMYRTENPDLFQVKKDSYLATVEVNATQEIWERFAVSGLVPNEDSENRLVFETDGKAWNRFFIPDTYGNKSNNIKADDVLTPDEYKTMLEVVNRIIPSEEKLLESTPTIPYNIGDTVYLENGTPFLIEEIGRFDISLRDPSLFYPVLRAESHESFTRLLERYPQPEKPQEKAENFRITDTHLGEGGKREKIAQNVAAIQTLQSIERENRPATKVEQEILSAYVGWGGLPEVFDKANSSFSGEYAQLKALLSEDEYEMARASTLNAHYTSPTVIKAIYDTVERMGFSTGNILEPACGTGNFFGMLPESMQGSKLYGVELDSITGRIAKQLYPSANIAIKGFEKTELPDSFFDLAIGNVPFGNYKLGEKRYDSQNFLIHDHFFAKALDKVRPGGVVAFVTSKGTMDKQSPEVRRYLAQRAELLGAIRLPNNAFLKNAGTEVTSDILFLQKRDRPIDVDRDWIHLAKDENDIPLNSYFAEHPEMILGTMELKSGQFGMESTCTPTPDADLAELLQRAAANIEGNIPDAELPDMELGSDTSIPADPTVKNFSYTLVDGEVYYRENSRMVRPELNQTAKERVVGLVELRECVNALIHYQLEDYSAETITQEQAKLNRLYDSFTAKYGLINSRGNGLAFSEDNSYYLLCSLEDIDENGNLKAKADMFTKRTIKKRVSITSVDTASEALALSIAEKAKVDIAYMEKLTGLSAEQIATDLRGVIFRLPDLENESNPHYVTADEYLSGNVRQKLRTANMAARVSDIYAPNVAALEAAQPKDLEAAEIDVRLGATWIDKEYVQQFMYELFDTPWRNQDQIEVKFAPFTAEWNITGKSVVGYNNVAAYVTYGTERANAYKILEDTLNLRDVRIYDTVTDPDGKERRVLNKDATTLAQQKQQTIKDAFRDWIWNDADRRQTLVKQYNEKFNSVRPREYDGQHINFSGINPEISLRPHQVNAIAHILYGNNTLLAHEVGAGKTFEMVAAAMESKRLGLCQKPLFAVPNHLTEQWASEFLRLYPAANILVATKKDFEKGNRKKFCARIATGDYDAVIIGHSQFERIPMSLERQERLLREQINEILDGIEEVKASGGERFTVKQLERTKKGLEERLSKLEAQERKDDVVTFEQLGVDRLYVDEAHNYKNLFLYTKMRNVAGLSTTDAQKSSDMFMKCRYMDELTGGKGIVFATGTPVSNSMTELYTMQRYLQYSTLQKNGLSHFDCWASTFGETVTAIELAPEGTGYRARTRFSKFFNLPELMSMFKEVADIKVADELDLPTPNVIYETVAVKPTEIQSDMVKELSERAAQVHANKVDPSIDNMLKITSDGRKLGLDQRIINPLLPDDEGSKVNACVNNLHRIWQEGAAEKLTQLVFCDISTPKGRTAAQELKAAKAGTQTVNGVELATLEDSLPDEVLTPTTIFNVYDDIRNKLVEKGIPAHQVAFIHEANTEVKKKELFAKVRCGDVRVLIGSTAKCGAGTNIQDRLVALHDLDCPWRPGDLTQRSGRIERQGNLNEEVNIFRYVTEATFDAYLWQTVENKQKFISQIMTSKSPVRSCEDVDEAALSYAEIKALCAGNPKIKEKMDLDIDVSRLKLLKANHQSSQYRLEDNLLKYFPENIEKNKGFIRGFEQDLKVLAEYPTAEGVFLPMVIKGDTLTDKDNAGAALLEACKEIKSSDPVEIGSYRGFTMFLSYGGMMDGHQLTLKGAMSHTAKLGMDARGNLTRIDNALAAMPERLQAVTDQLDNLYKQQEAAKAELGKPFPQEQELKDKVSRLATLDAELNMDMGVTQPQPPMDRVSKSSRPSVLESLKMPPTAVREPKAKHDKGREER